MTDDDGASDTAVVTIEVISLGDYDEDGDVDGVDLSDPEVGWEALYGQTVETRVYDGFAFLNWQNVFTGSKVTVPDVVNMLEGSCRNCNYGSWPHPRTTQRSVSSYFSYRECD